MRLIIGTDEAGYGPNLGPLVVTATAWRCASDILPEDLWHGLRQVLTNAPHTGDHRLYVADSKAVYQSGDSLEALEVPVLAFLGLLGQELHSVEGLGAVLCGGEFSVGYQGEPWNGGGGAGLPVDSSSEHIDEWVQELRSALQEAGTELLGIRSRVIFPAEFNRLVAEVDSKGAVLSAATLKLVRQQRDAHPTEPALVVCDKHGGRNRYDELIGAHFDDQFVFRLEESRERSRYKMGSMEFCFRTKAEALLPAALSSMVSKYVRELLMRQFNAWWQARVPGLKSPQGYPVDARRFLDDIQSHLQRLNIRAEALWRNR
jgi:ribonuclease HII